MDRRRVPYLLAALLLSRGVPLLLAQQTAAKAEVPALDLAELTARALRTGSDVKAAELAYEQARLQYAQAKARNGASLGANAVLSHDTEHAVICVNWSLYSVANADGPPEWFVSDDGVTA